jgi:hypothetical protein
LPKDPPWIGHFERKPIPPPRGKPSRSVVAFVHRQGVPAAGVRVRIGRVMGPTRELMTPARSSSGSWRSARSKAW